MGNPRVLRRLPRRLRRGRPAPKPAALERAVASFLAAAGLDPADPALLQTPRLVATAWTNQFLDGYQKSPEEVLNETFPAPEGATGMVVLTDLRFHSMCPHHLLPYTGRAHLAYVPGQRVVGFGRLGALLKCFAHRLILQEELAQQVARSLCQVLQSPAAACIIEAEQSCLRLLGEHQQDAVTHTEAYEGLLREDGPLRRELWARIRSGR